MKSKFLIQFILLFIVCLFSTTAMASEHLYTDSNGLTWRFELENGEATLISDNDEDGTYDICVTGDNFPSTLIVPSRVKVGSVEYPVVAIGWDAFAYGWLSSTSIVLPEGVTRIEAHAFYDATNLKSIHIPSSVISIGVNAFNDCNNLEKAEFESIESLCNIEFGFYSSEMGMYTYTANPLTYAHHLYIDGEEVTDVIIPRSVTSIKRGVFWGCNNITSVFIPATVTSIDHWAFANGPRSFIVNWQTPISIPSDAFQYEHGGGIPDGSNLYVPYGTGSTYDTADYWKDFNIIEMDELSNILFADANVKALCVDNWDTNGDGELNEDEANAATTLGEVFKGNTTITSFDELQYFTGLTSINSMAFYNCNRLTSVTIPNSVTSIDADAFCWCSYLTSVTIPNGVTTIAGDAFAMCPAMTTISIPEGVTSIGDCAFSSTGLTSITIPSSVTDIGIDVFYNCRDLTSITVDTENNAYDSRENCNAIIETATNTLVTGCKNSFIPSDVINIGYSAFDGCSGLTSIDIPTNVTSIGQEALYGCSGLTSITIPNSVISIGSIAFKRCSGLTSVISEIEDPYAFGSGAFDEISSTCTLTVPAGTRDAYIAAGWTTDVFKGGIVEMEGPVENESLTLGQQGIRTFSSPYELDFTNSTIKAYIASGFSPSTGDLILTRVYNVPAGEGLLLKGEAGDYEVPCAETDMVYSNLLKGVVTATNVSPADGGSTNFILANGSHGIGFYTLSEEGEIGAGKAYLQLPTSSIAAMSRTINLLFDDEEEKESTELTEIENVESSANEYFDLQGRPIPASSLKSGFYIIRSANGGKEKKVFIK